MCQFCHIIKPKSLKHNDAILGLGIFNDLILKCLNSFDSLLKLHLLLRLILTTYFSFFISSGEQHVNIVCEYHLADSVCFSVEEFQCTLSVVACVFAWKTNIHYYKQLMQKLRKAAANVATSSNVC